MLMLVQNTLDSQLLQRSLQLLAALLQADAAVEEERQQQQLPPLQLRVYESLLQAGLMNAVTTVLAPTVEVGNSSLMALISTAADGSDVWADVVYGAVALRGFPQQQQQDHSAANSGEGAAAAGGDGSWSEDEDEADMMDDEGDAAANSIQQRTLTLYRSEYVLEALLQLLLQLGSRAESAAAAVQKLPALPGFLVDVLAVSSFHQHQKVLEALLPVLVLFKEWVLPMLQPVQDRHMQQHMQQQQLAEVAPAEQQQQQQQQEEEERQTKGLALLACIAGTLQDCEAGAHTLDTLDAGWYLMALATHSMQVLQQHMQQQLQDQQQQQQLARQHVLIACPASCRFLDHLCTRLSRSTLPETAANYAAAVTQALTTCVAPILADDSLAPQVLYPLHVLYPQLAHQAREEQGIGEADDDQPQEPEPPGVAIHRMHTSILRACSKLSHMASRLQRPVRRSDVEEGQGESHTHVPPVSQPEQQQQQQQQLAAAGFEQAGGQQQQQ
jgi:ferredoxin-like protein FixX